MFDGAAGPMNLKGIDGGRVADAEVRALIVGGFIASAAEYVGSLLYSASRQIGDRTYGVARAFWPTNQLQTYPMMVIGADTPHEGRDVVH